MSSVKIRAALETALNAMSPALATAWENTDFAPPSSSTPYQRAFVMFAEPDNPAFGGGMHRELGIFQINLLYPIQAGSAQAGARAELIRAAFPRGSTFSNSGVTVVISRTPEIGQGTIDGDRWFVPVKIRFHSNIIS